MRLIEADKVENFFKTIRSRAYFKYNPQAKEGAELIMDYIRELDTIDPESLRKHALWMKITCSFLESENNAAYVCSNCGWYRGDLRFKYCPNCGAKMDLEDKK